MQPHEPAVPDTDESPNGHEDDALADLTVEQEIELRRLRLAEMQEERAQVEAEREYNARAYRDTNRVATLEAYIRALLAGILVVGTIAAVFVGILQGIDGSELSQYLAPVTGLAGLAVGYFFGRGTTGGGGQGGSGA